jgi:hypothetical protein
VTFSTYGSYPMCDEINDLTRGSGIRSHPRSAQDRRPMYRGPSPSPIVHEVKKAARRSAVNRLQAVTPKDGINATPEAGPDFELHVEPTR